MTEKNCSIATIAKNVLQTEADALAKLAKNLPSDFIPFTNAVIKSKGRVVVAGVGKSGHIGRKISATLASTGTPSYFVHATEASHGDLGGITKKDVILAISNSGQSNELNGIINYAKRYNIPLLSISSNKKGILYQKSTYGILYKKPIEACPNNLAPTSSTTMMLIIGDAIAVSLIKMKGFKKTHFDQIWTAR